MQSSKLKTQKYKLPIIGISCGSSTQKERKKRESYNRVPDEYVKAIECAGGIPILIPFLEKKENIKVIVEKIDGLLLPGGRDIEPNHYGEKPAGVKETDLLKDALEFPLIEFAIKRGLPILGICRGCQIFNVVSGGTLIQDIKTNIKHRYGDIPRNKITHNIKIEKNSLLFKIVGKEKIGVNSFHHQAVKDVAKGFRASAYAEDGIIEAIEGKSSPFILGVQCHIEHLWQKNPLFKNIFVEFVRASLK